ncbi:ornithine cyclodeaminase/alanine dehydrogenase [Rhodoligotrophos appendicifer]|uniref:ornithine cyclodeaminase family protein n=1 Tax=Rhodoligotrophos appendicifer TaxID=987056 RepID=UPI00117F184C|nr:ornithine cyclodeaminase family protein [Rhodoligotrophos appendicifer]
MSRPHHLLYLSRADLEQLNLPMSEIIDAVTEAFLEKAKGQTLLPPKHWIPAGPRRFFSAMSGQLAGLGTTVCKWQSGSPDNHLNGQPYITGQLILNDMATGLPMAIMDSTWTTGQRTAAATAVAARALANPSPAVLGIMGCGVQGRSNLEAFRLVFPSLRTVRCFDIEAAAMERYRREMTARHEGLDVICCGGAQEAMAGAQLIVTCGPIVPDAPRSAKIAWVDPGATVVTLDYDCYWEPAAFGAFAQVFSDDLDQLDHTREFGYFSGVPATARELAAVVAGTEPGRRGREERIAALNLGIALEDAATALCVYRAAKAKGVGLELPI